VRRSRVLGGGFADQGRRYGTLARMSTLAADWESAGERLPAEPRGWAAWLVLGPAGEN
jgi:hypothetical protein